jgi:hypothetical protein
VGFQWLFVSPGQLCGRWHATLEFSWSASAASDYNPGFALDADTVRRLAECGAISDLDFYHYYTDQHDNDRNA